MDKIKVVHDQLGRTLTIWFGNPRDESCCEETADEVVLIKNGQGKIIGVEILNVGQGQDVKTLAIETVVNTAA